MRIRRIWIVLAALAVAALLGCVWAVLRVRSAPGTGDVSVVFLGLTNDPGGSVHLRRLAVMSNGRGLHALFGVTNITPGRYVNFGLAAIEAQGRAGWRTNDPGYLTHELGNGFAPGDGYCFAFPWPDGLKTDTPWRLRLWVTRQPRAFSIGLHHQGYGLRPYGRHTVTSDVVVPPGPAVAEPGAQVGSPQPLPDPRGQ